MIAAIFDCMVILQAATNVEGQLSLAWSWRNRN